MLCHFCHSEIPAGQEHYHHLVPVADGGALAGQTVPCHRDCHNQWHRDQGHYERWTRAQYAERCATFGATEVHRLLSFWGRRGYVAASGADPCAWHRAGWLARAANSRDARGRFVTTPKETR